MIEKISLKDYYYWLSEMSSNLVLVPEVPNIDSFSSYYIDSIDLEYRNKKWYQIVTIKNEPFKAVGMTLGNVIRLIEFKKPYMVKNVGLLRSTNNFLKSYWARRPIKIKKKRYMDYESTLVMYIDIRKSGSFEIGIDVARQRYRKRV